MRDEGRANSAGGDVSCSRLRDPSSASGPFANRREGDKVAIGSLPPDEVQRPVCSPGESKVRDSKFGPGQGGWKAGGRLEGRLA